MERRKLEMIVRSASGLDDVRRMGQMRVYVTASLSDDPATVLQKTEVDTTGGTNPVWNSNMSFSISQAHFQHLNLVFGLYCERTLLGEKRFGEVHVPLNVLRAEHSDAYTEVSYPVSNLKNNSHRGKLNFSYRFQDNLPYPRAPPNHPNTMGAGSTSRPPLMRPQRPQNPWHSPQSAMPPPQNSWTRRDNIALAGVGIAAAGLVVAGGQLGAQITNAHGEHGEVNGQQSNNHDSTGDHNVGNDASPAWNMDGVGNEYDYESPSWNDYHGDYSGVGEVVANNDTTSVFDIFNAFVE
ncbi:hypothetical protein Sjap_006801 [Stephania japonica]|uniref:C2 domain-containing protein n=1 Tax=Stephania japonica TaxID=461633 RepID=A0AAP0K870_9MAGN